MKFSLIRLGLALLAACLMTAPAAAQATCPGDFDRNGNVAGNDLGILLASWGPVTCGNQYDLNNDCAINGADLGIFLSVWGPCPPTVFRGVVLLANGTPVTDAVVVTNLGGTATSGKGGAYELELVPAGPVTSVTVSAVASLGGTTYQGSQVVSPVTVGGVNQVSPIVMAATDCPQGFGWLPGFAAPGTSGGQVYALTVFNDGSGSALYVGGTFTSAGGVAANRIAKWNGTSWSPLGSGMLGTGVVRVGAMTVFNDGTGPALYAGGTFTSAGGVAGTTRIAKWNGTSWSPLGSGISGSNGFVHDLTVFNDGTGAALYAAGDFTTAGGIAANDMARWNGTSWSPLGSGMSGANFSSVYALTVFDDGTGSALYAGGAFETAGGVAANDMARWNGTSWSPVGSGPGGGVDDLTVFNDGTGSALYAFGSFGDAANIAKWNGTSWSPVGSGIDNGCCGSVMTVFDDGTGPALIVGGNFIAAGGVALNNIGKWNGTAWSSFPSGGNGMAGDFKSVDVLTVLDDGTGPVFYAGGSFTTAGGVVANKIAKWNGTSWSPLGAAYDNRGVYALTVFNDGTGPALYAAGNFVTMGGDNTLYIAKWDGTSWISLGSGMNGNVQALTVFDDGTGPALYAGGDFTTAGGVTANRIAKWNGTTWSPLGTGVSGSVRALTGFNDGTGQALYAGGAFTTAGGVAANRIAKWNGTAWSPLGTGVNGTVNALTGFGPALYTGGSFTTAGGVASGFIAKWGCTN